MDLLRNRAIIEANYYTVGLLVKRSTLISYLYFLSDVYVLIIYEWPTTKTSSLRFWHSEPTTFYLSAAIVIFIPSASRYIRSHVKLVPSSNRVLGHLNCSCVSTGKIQQNNHKYAIAGVTKIPHENGYHEYASATGTMIPHANVHARCGGDKDSAQDRCMRIYHKYAMRT